MNAQDAAQFARRFIQLPSHKRALFLEALEAEGVDFSVFPIVAAAREATACVSYAQQRMWFLWRLDPQSAAYHLPLMVRLRGPIQREKLQHAFDALIHRHEALRTVFLEGDDDAVVARVAPPASLPIRFSDRSGCAASGELDELIEARIAQPFDLAQGPLLRLDLIKTGEQEHVLLVVAHHIAADGWSLNLLIEEVIQGYATACQGLPGEALPLPIQYQDYARWQRAWLQAGGEAPQLDYWRAKLGQEHAPLALPFDRAPGPVPDAAGARVECPVSPALANKLRALATAHSTTLFTVLLAAFKVTLQRYCGARVVRVGVPVANRHRAETEGLIGCFINTQVLQTDMDPALDSASLLDRVKATALGAQAHQDIPFDRVVEVLELAGSADRQPVFQVMFNHQAEVREFSNHVSVAGLRLEPVVLPSTSVRFDLALDTFEQAGRLVARFGYRSALFDATTVQSIAASWLESLAWFAEGTRQALGDGTGLAALPEASTAHWNGKPVHEAIREAARTHPERVAVVAQGRSLTYGELLRQAEALAQALRERGCTGEEVVGVVGDRSPEMVVGILAILLAGACYLPLDPEQPAERLRLCLADAGVKRLVITGASPEWADAVEPVSVHSSPVGVFTLRPVFSGQLAYLIYTSGTTGRPKGVAISHGALGNYVEGVAGRVGLDDIEQLAMVSTPAADLGHTAFFTALCHGRTLQLFDKDQVLDAQRFSHQMAQVDLLKIVPSHLQALLDAGEGHVLPKRCLVLGGEAVKPRLLQAVARLAPGVRVINHYGPTETTVGALTSQLTAEAREPSLGVALPNLKARVLDASLLSVPGKAGGELCIAGAGLARGYLGQPGLTAERFVPDPFSAPGGRLYRTGDRVRRNAQGLPVFVGRGDGQVKVRGHRIELAEVESQLGACSGVRHALVRLDGEGDTARVLGYAVAGAGASEARLLEQLRATLAEAMLPSRIMLLESLPLTANGKVDFKSLPLPDVQGVGPGYQAPVEPLDVSIAQVWAKVLEVERVGLRDNFFALGGHSLLATQVTSRLRRLLGREVPLRALFDAPDLQGFAQAVAKLATSAAGAIARQPRSAPLPVSHAQHRQWLFWKLHPASTAYHTPLAVRWTGMLDVDALRGAFQALIRRHEALRTLFVETQGTPRQQILPAMAFDLPVEDVTGQDQAQWLPRIDAAVREPFDLAQGPLLRGLLLKVDTRQHVLVLTLHHIVSDGWSMGVMVRECLASYQALTAGGEDALAVPEVQYADYAVWQRGQLEGGLLEAQSAYWKATLEDDFEVLPLPCDHSRPAVQSHRGARLDVRLAPHLCEQLQALAVSHNATLFHVLLAAFGLLLARYTGRDKVNIGVPMTNRNRLELEALMGFFVNTLVLRLGVDGAQGFDRYLGQVREVALQAQAHKELPFDALVEALQPERGTGHNPLFQVMFNHLRDVGAQVKGESLEGLHLEEIDLAETSAQFDLALNTLERSDGVLASFTYATDLFEQPRIERMAKHWVKLLESIVEAPRQAIGELPMLALDESARLLSRNTSANADFTGLAIHRLFECQAEATPGAVALIEGEVAWSYRALDARANALAHALGSAGVGPGTRVAIAMPRTAQMVAALYAVFKVGGAYVPLDPSYPEQRLSYMLHDSQAALVMVEGDSCPALRSQAEVAFLDIAQVGATPNSAPSFQGAPQDLAYCIYTSGSTGQPKGVMIEHRNVAALVAWTAKVYSREDLQGVLAATSICFDLSVWELFVTLALGGKIILADNALQLPSLPARDQVKLINTVPSAIRTLCEAGQIPPSVRVINLAGELLKQAVVDDLYENTGVQRIYDLYGPSEDTTYSTFTLRQAAGHDNIGRPIDHSRAYLLDTGLQPVPEGHAAELFMAGAGLARGYLNRPGLTAQRFVPDPLASAPGERMYRTADLGRYGSEGQLECLGRIDHQVKVRGFRIELGEIESQLRGFGGLRDLAVVARERGTGSELVAYLVPQDASWLDSDPAHRVEVERQLRAFLRQALPEYMIPAHWVVLRALPLTPNGKLDRHRLPAPQREAARPDRRMPATALGREVAALWAQVLAVESVGLDDNFFELGGHSLLATQITARLQAQLQIELPLLELFQAPTLEAFVNAVERRQKDNGQDMGELSDWLDELETL